MFLHQKSSSDFCPLYKHYGLRTIFVIIGLLLSGRLSKVTEQLFGSKTRVKLLSLFLNNPGRPFYVREITRKIDEQINSVRRELANLLSVGVIKSDTEKNRLYYEVNQKFRYYNELHSIFGSITSTPAIEETREEDHILKQLRSTGTINLAFLCGDFVRDNHIGIDLFVVGDINRTRIIKAIAQLENELKRELNYTIMSLADYNYRLNLSDRFLANLLDAKKIVLIDTMGVTDGAQVLSPEPAKPVEPPAETEIKEEPVSVPVEAKK